MKTNYDLGRNVQLLLQKNNLENSANWRCIDSWHDEKYIKQLEVKLAEFIQDLGLDLTNTSLTCTPKRIVKLFIEDLFWGLDYRNFPDICCDDNSFAYAQSLISKNINLQSTCEHHFVAIRGYAAIGYIPKNKIIGLGKLNQIVNFFAHRPQVQERLTRQIFIVLQYILDTQDVAVAINAHHDCISRHCGSDKENEVLTIDLGGRFLNDESLNASFRNLNAK
jgi:GTP cyclohydrolase IA